MRLRQRIILTLAAIAFILAIPAAYGALKLYQVTSIARELRVRDTRANETLGGLRTSIEELVGAEDRYVALINIGPAQAATVRANIDDAITRTDSLIGFLEARSSPSATYRRAVRNAAAEFVQLKRVIREEQRLLPFPNNDLQNQYRNEHTNPAIQRMYASLRPIQPALDREAAERVRNAEEIAKNARNTTLVSLGLALVLTLAVGFLMTRAMLRPIEELRRGMAHVAEGDFDPNVQVPVERTDEIGELSRSFATMTAQLAELDRLKAEFVSVASHEIKTPLSVIRGYVSLLSDGIYGEISDQQKKTLESVSDQVDRLTRLVHRLLDISRFEAGGGRLELRRINVRDFLDELTGGFHVLAFQNGIDFAVNVAGDAPVNIEGDADRLNEVLGNILSNAFKFTERGGRISLDARRNGAGLEVEVRDSGVGIPPDKLPKIFEKFYQVDNSAQPRSAGSGLGLAIAREIVEAHGGTITAESEVGKGTTFCVTLPERPPVSRAVEMHVPQGRR
ncbi:MAG TPA: HAMP domain-containing sensor histidine kinase [Longimicrobiaceae bacterium]|nr:HAMP domain-containing sensor histidine kinase [Longimicrobiaceae bacterium]